MSLRGRYPRDDRLQNFVDADARLGAGLDGFLRRDGKDFLQLTAHAGQIGVGQVDLVDDGNDGQPLLHGQMHVGNRLRLDALRGIDDEQRALAGGQTARNLVGEIDVAGRVEQIEPVFLPAFRLVAHRHRVRLDRDPPLALQVHGVQELVLFFALLDGAGAFEEAVGERGLAVIDVGDDAEIAGKLGIGHRRPCTMRGRVPERQLRPDETPRIAAVEATGNPPGPVTSVHNGCPSAGMMSLWVMPSSHPEDLLNRP